MKLGCFYEREGVRMKTSAESLTATIINNCEPTLYSALTSLRFMLLETSIHKAFSKLC